MSTHTTEYDHLPYPSRSYEITHPDHLATIGRLFGVPVTPVEACRVLELGCANGDNLLPMAANLPGSRFIGIDLSSRQIEKGRQAIDTLSLPNIELTQADILDLDASLGSFDYILCHGVFSWVPEPVRHHILALCRSCLAPHGIACLSYNVYPGWHLADALRSILRYHGDASLPYADRVAQARALMEVLARGVGNRKDLSGAFLAKELTFLANSEDGYLFSEYLAEENQPYHFHQFISMAQAHGLAYLGEAEQSTMVVDQQAPEIAAYLQGCRDVIEAQQYLDFFLVRRFRVTLLCHAEQEIDQVMKPERAYGLFARAAFQFEDLQAGEPERPQTVIVNSKGTHATLVGLPMRTALQILQRSGPQAISLSRLFKQVREICWTGTNNSRGGLDHAWLEALQEDLARQLIGLFFAQLVDLHTRSVPVLSRVPQWPRATPLARFQAGRGDWVTNQWHQIARLDELSREVLMCLDGTRSLDDLAARLESNPAAVEVGRVVQETYGQSWSIEGALKRILELFCEAGLLIP